MDTTALKSCPLDAALLMFQECAGLHLADEEEEIARWLLNAVDTVPLAVTLLGQLARRGITVTDLRDRFNREHDALLQSHMRDTFSGLEVAIQLSIAILCTSDVSEEALHLLSVCSLLPDGLRPTVFDELRPQFEHIESARDNLTAFDLVNMDADQVLRTPSPIPSLVQDRYPAQPNHRNVLVSYYYTIADRLPVELDQNFAELAHAAAPELGNLSSLLLATVDRPSQRTVDAVVNYTRFQCWQKPTVDLASALLPHLEAYPQWKASCLQVIGQSQVMLGESRQAIDSLAIAARLHLQNGDRSSAAKCKSAAGDTYGLAGEHDRAVALLHEACVLYTELGNEIQVAKCRSSLGNLLRTKKDYPNAIGHLIAARQTFYSFAQQFEAAKCSESLGSVHLELGDLNSAAVELEAARSAFIAIGSQFHIAQTTHLLSSLKRQSGELALAEQLQHEAQLLYQNNGNQLGLAKCSDELGRIRRDQGRQVEAEILFESARQLYRSLGL